MSLDLFPFERLALQFPISKIVQDPVPPVLDLLIHLKMKKIMKMVLITMFTWRRRTNRIMMGATIERWKRRMTVKDTTSSMIEKRKFSMMLSQLRITMNLSFQKFRMRISNETNDFEKHVVLQLYRYGPTLRVCCF